MWDPSRLKTPQLDTLVGYRPLHAHPVLCQNLNITIWSPIFSEHLLSSSCELPGSAPTTDLERLRLQGGSRAGWTAGAGRARPARVFIAGGPVQQGGQIINLWGSSLPYSLMAKE